MARWLVSLNGEGYDLYEFSRWFSEGEIYSFRDSKGFYLAGERFEEESEHWRVREIALQSVDEFSGVICLLVSSFSKPEVGNVIREDDLGSRATYLPEETIFTLKQKVIRPDMGDMNEVDKARNLLSGARSDHYLRMAISLWGDPLKSWPRLYRILEEVEKHLGGKVDEVFGCGGADIKNDRERFRRSANHADVSGKDARHAPKGHQPPDDPMSHEDAVKFVGSMLYEAAFRASRGG